MNFLVNRNHWIILFFIILLGGFLRLFLLSTYPSGFHGDEAAYGYNAYSILKTGTDEYGKHFPLTLKSFEDYKPALYSYIDIPFIVVLGLTETAVRFPSALFGTLSIWVLYLVVKEVFPKDEGISLLTAFLLAISPWHLMFSRSTSEVVVAIFFLLVMAWGLLKLRSYPSWKWGIITFLSAVFALASYTEARIFVGIVLFFFFLMSIKKIKEKMVWSSWTATLLIVVFVVELLYNGITNNNRFNQVSIFNNTTTQLSLRHQLSEDQFTPIIITHVFHNKIINYSRTILNNYSMYFSLNFLALEGGLPLREKIPDVGLFYIWEMFFLIAGIYFLCRKYPWQGALLGVLLLALLFPTALTYDDIPNMYRSLVMVPILVIVIAIGMKESYSAVRLFKPKVLMLCALLVCCSLVIFEFCYFVHQYTVHSTTHQPWYRDYAMKGLVTSMNQYGSGFKKIMITKVKTSYIHILFFNKIDPKLYQASGSKMDIDFTGFGPYEFVPRECALGVNKGLVAVGGEKDVLYVNAGTCPVPLAAAQILATIYWTDGTPAYRLLKYSP